VDIEHTFRDLQSYLYQIIESRAVIAYQWAGDGLVCLFENAESAVEAALVIQAGLARFNVEDNRLAEDIQVRIGVHTGVLLYNGHGTIGEMRSETLDVAGHLQKDAEAGRVVITEATYGRLNRDRLKARFQPAGVSRDGHTIYCR
jgi:class 3 adenylate cyclase